MTARRPKGAPGVLAGTHRAQRTNDELGFYPLAHLMSLPEFRQFPPQAISRGFAAFGIKIDREKLRACWEARGFELDMEDGWAEITIRFKGKKRVFKRFRNDEEAAKYLGVLGECLDMSGMAK